jgi:hypothetical protein
LIHTQNLPPSAFLSDTNPFFQRWKSLFPL